MNVAKPIPRHQKMYRNSPTLETDENGKKYIKKNTAAKDENSGATLESVLPPEIQQKQSKERNDMFVRQQQEFMEMHSRHLTETTPAPQVASPEPQGE